jgi:hypothetical protein
MTSEKEGLIGKADDPDPTGDPRPETQSIPDEENVGGVDLEEDLQDPDEKRNATDGYAPADDGFNPTDAEDDLEKFEG